MKKTFLLVVLGLFVFNASGQDYRKLITEGNHTVQYISEVAERHFDSVGTGRGTGFKIFKRWQYFAERAMDETGRLKSPEFYYKEIENYNASTNNEGLAARTTVGTWEEMGPTYWDATSGWNPGVGRITSLAVDESNLDHIIAGSETGGVWKSMDGGSTWIVLSDNLSNIDVYALAIDPADSNTYYWGSTSGTILKSTDAGLTWSPLGSLVYGVVNKILVDPTNSMKIYASVQGNGLYKSIDGGITWSSIYFVSTGTGYDFEFKPNDPNVVYASGNAFYVSTNGGASFAQITGSGGNQFSNGPKMIGVSSDDPNVVYVVEANSGVFGALYISNNSGSSFSKLTHTQNFFGYDSNGSDNLGQAPRDMDIVINPNDVNDVHIAGINTWRSTDGGVNFNITSQWVPGVANGSGIGYCHADVDILHFAGTGTDAKLYTGTDGGIFRADDPVNVSTNYYTDLTPGLGIRQFYKIGVSQTDPVVVTGGSQDNGTSTLREDGLWTDWLGADGMEGFIDKNNPSIMYGTTQFGGLFRTQYDLVGNSNLASLTQPDNKGGQSNWNWVVPFEQDPIVQNTVYVAFDQVYKSMDSGNNWTPISPNFGSNIDHFKISPSNNQIMYCAINGVLRYTTDGGANWVFSPLNLGPSIINEIAIHPSDPNKVAVATTDSQKVYVSLDGGLTWASKLMNLPGFVAQALVWQDNGDDGLYVGMNYGVFYTDNTLTQWEPFNNGLPNVRINELEINTADNKIYAATYGRGLWRSDVFDASLSVEDFEFNDLTLYPNPAKNEINLKWNKTEDVSIRIFDTQGKIMFYGKKVNLYNGFKVDVSSFSNGIYFVKLNSTNGEITKKLILN
jgi:photosystem II stability/assembly factor-like uncharacterized protein